MHQSPSIYDAVPTAERRSLDMPNILIMVALNSIFIFRLIARFLLISCARVRRILSAYAFYYSRSLRRFTLCVVHRARRYFSAVNIFAWIPKRTKISAEPTVAPTVEPSPVTTDSTTTSSPDEVDSPVDSTNAESPSTTATPAAEPPSDPPSSRRLVRDHFRRRTNDDSTIARFRGITISLRRSNNLQALKQRNHRWFRHGIRHRKNRPAERSPPPKVYKGSHQPPVDEGGNVTCDPKYAPCFSYRQRILSALFGTFAYTTTEATDHDDSAPIFDCDSTHFAIDPGASATIGNRRSDFGELRPTPDIFLQGVGGKVPVVGVGTLTWEIIDDRGTRHCVTIKDAYFVPAAPLSLLSPQQWALQRLTEHGDKDNPHFMTTAHFSTLNWNYGQCVVTIPHDAIRNLPIWRTAPGYKKFSAFASELFCMSTGVVSDNDDSDDESDSDATTPTSNVREVPLTREALSTPSTGLPQTRERSRKRRRRRDASEEPPVPPPTRKKVRQRAKRKESRRASASPEPEDKSRPFPFSPTTHSDTVRPPDVVEDPNLPSDQKELLTIHHKLGHLSFSRIKKLAQVGVLPKRFLNCREPRCAECLYGKQTRRPWRHTKVKGKIGKLPIDPGDTVSVDQLQSPAVTGLIPQVTGILTTDRYTVATIFVDHASDFTYVHFQKSASGAETLKAKQEFERRALSHGVTIRHYHADNGIFAGSVFQQAIRDARQKITFCGVGAHHQNGIAEKRIRDLTEHARTMLIHATHRWPRAVNAHLWPYALRLAVHLRNAVPRSEGDYSPHQHFSGLMDATLDPKQEHPFGCPVYVLSDHLQTGNPHGKWKDRARVGVYLGHSPDHASTVAYILNVTTGHVSAQFHVVFDDHFDTVLTTKRDMAPSLWQSAANLPESDPDEPFEAPSVTTIPEIPRVFQAPWYRTHRDASRASTAPSPDTPLAQPIPRPIDDNPVSSRDSAPTTLGTNDAPDDVTDDPDIGSASSPTQARSGSSSRSTSAEPLVNPTPEVPDDLPHALPITTRSGRTVHLTQRAREATSFPSLQAHTAYLEILATLPDGTINDTTFPSAFLSTSGDPDTLYLSDARKQADWADFKLAMDKEVEDFNQRGHWEIVSRKSLMHLQAYDIVKAIWSFKRKRRPTGELLKHKARLCAHGGQQTKGVTYHETYSPVVNWFTLRLFIVLSLIYDWKTRQVDFVLAFPQAELASDVYMELPYGFHVEPQGDWVLKLKRNVYGLKDAGRTWHLHLKKGLTDRGFTASLVDPCVFYKGDLILIIYVDDMICMCPTDAPIDEFLTGMQAGGFTLTDQGDVNEYLGIKVAKEDDDSTMHLTQPHLIDKILKSAGLKDTSKMHATPAAIILNKFKESKATTDTLDYRSVIGQMNYLAMTTRPDIAFAVHQCARFCSDPRKPHYEAVKRIARYLALTRDKGLTLRPGDPTMECYVDADFAGTWTKEYSDDSSTALSRTGFVINFAGCPVVWASKMQTEIALSTTEAEYIALSAAMRDVIPVRALLNELSDHGLIQHIGTSKVRCTVFEDNASCLELALAPKMRPRTKHINIKYHHFRSHIHSDQNPDGTITIQHVGTKDQTADIFTKPLTIVPFEHLRAKLMGW
jgi:hypothetical protein